MSRRQLYLRLCAITTALEQEAQRGPVTPRAAVLWSLVGALDKLIDDVVDAKAPQAWGWCEDESPP